MLVIAVKPGYNSTFDDVDTPEAQTKIGQALQRLVHRPIRIKYIRRFVEEQGDALNRGQMRHSEPIRCQKTRWFNACSSSSRRGPSRWITARTTLLPED